MNLAAASSRPNPQEVGDTDTLWPEGDKPRAQQRYLEVRGLQKREPCILAELEAEERTGTNGARAAAVCSGGKNKCALLVP